MDALTIRRAVRADAGPIARIHCTSWRSAYADILDRAFLAGPIEADRLALWSGRLTGADAARGVLVAETPSREPVGFVCFEPDRDASWGSLVDNLHVLPALRGGGIGERLLRAAADGLAARARGIGLHLWVFAANTGARRFYRRLAGEEMECAVSQIAAARRATVLRVHWPDLAALAQDGANRAAGQ